MSRTVRKERADNGSEPRPIEPNRARRNRAAPVRKRFGDLQRSAPRPGCPNTWSGVRMGQLALTRVCHGRGFESPQGWIAGCHWRLVRQCLPGKALAVRRTLTSGTLTAVFPWDWHKWRAEGSRVHDRIGGRSKTLGQVIVPRQPRRAAVDLPVPRRQVKLPTQPGEPPALPPVQHLVPPAAYAHHVEALSLEDDLSHGFLAVVTFTLEPVAHFHPADLAL